MDQYIELHRQESQLQKYKTGLLYESHLLHMYLVQLLILNIHVEQVDKLEIKHTHDLQILESQQVVHDRFMKLSYKPPSSITSNKVVLHKTVSTPVTITPYLQKIQMMKQQQQQHGKKVTPINGKMFTTSTPDTTTDISVRHSSLNSVDQLGQSPLKQLLNNKRNRALMFDTPDDSKSKKKKLGSLLNKLNFSDEDDDDDDVKLLPLQEKTNKVRTLFGVMSPLKTGICNMIT